MSMTYILPSFEKGAAFGGAGVFRTRADPLGGPGS